MHLGCQVSAAREEDTVDLKRQTYHLALGQAALGSLAFQVVLSHHAVRQDQTRWFGLTCCDPFPGADVVDKDLQQAGRYGESADAVAVLDGRASGVHHPSSDAITVHWRTVVVEPALMSHLVCRRYHVGAAVVVV